MKKIIVVSIISAMILSIAVACSSKDKTGPGDGGSPNVPPVTDIPEGNNVEFRDDFDSGSLPSTFWGLCVPEFGDDRDPTWNRFFKYTEGYEAVRIQDGNLVLSARHDNGKIFKTGGVYSHKNRYGVGTRLSVRAKLKGEASDTFTSGKKKGAFPAVWYYPLFTKNEWPDDGEIDLMEWIVLEPTHAWTTIHYRKSDGGTASKSPYVGGVNNNINMDEYHVYTCDILKDKVILYVDGKVTCEFTPNDPAGQKKYPYNDNTFYIILNASYQNGSWGPGPDENSSANYEMWVDWVEVQKIDPNNLNPEPPKVN